METPDYFPSCRAIVVWNGKILLHHRDNKPDIPNPDSWTFPGGGVEKDETPDEGIVRELKEETSYSPKSLHYLGYRVNENATITHIFFAYISANEAKLFKKGIEGQGIGFFTLEEINKLNFPILRGSGKLLEKYRKVFEKIIKAGQIPSARDLGLR